MSSLFCSHHAIVVHFGFEHVLRSKTGWSFSISFATIFFRIVLHALMACVAIFYFKMRFAPQGRFFDTSTSIHPRSSIFLATFDFPMCFAPHWAAMFHFLFGKPTSQGAFFSNRWSHRTLESIFFRDVRAFSRTCVFFFWVSPSLTSDLVFFPS